MTDEMPVQRFGGRDGLELVYREMGEGWPLVLLHGFMGDGMQWVRHGPAAELARHGHRVILPDLRGHGDSARPHDPDAYPPDVMADDAFALIDHLGLDDYDLGGYSFGARIVLRTLVRGARPAHAIVAGQGLDVISRATSRTSTYRDTLTGIIDGAPVEPDSPAGQLAHWITVHGQDPRALRNVLDTHVPTAREALFGITTPTLVAVGDGDDTHSSADALADALPDARFVRVPGNHFTALAAPEFAAAILALLDGPPR